jgi:hypothetical protein
MDALVKKMPELVGAKILNLRRLTPSEIEDHGWDGQDTDNCVVIELDNGSVIFPVGDMGMNGPGVLNQVKGTVECTVFLSDKKGLSRT